MTDLVSATNADNSSINAPTEQLPPMDGDRPLEWAPLEPAPKKKRLGLWIGLGAGVVVLGAAAASMILIAPGTTVAGIPVGGMTQGAAAEAIDKHLTDTQITLTDAGNDVVISGADLGARLDAASLAEQAFTTRPMWNVTTWMGDPIAADVVLDAEAADATLRAAVPESFSDPVDATVVFDPASNTYVSTPAAEGTGIDVGDLTTAIAAALADGGKTELSFSAAPTVANPDISDEEAAETVASLNAMLSTVGFYVGEERTVPMAAADVASWLTLNNVDGELTVEADAAAIQGAADGLAPLINREAVNATTVVDSNGKVLEELTVGKTGRQLGDISNAGSEFAAKLEDGNGVLTVDVAETEFEVTTLFRRIEVDLSEQRTYLYENDKVVQSWSVSSGTSATPTDQGHFRVYAQLTSQTMRGYNGDGSMYETPNVPWVTYFNGDEGFHGTYWHSNFGTPMSHGCLNMTIDAAKTLWEWTTEDMEVWVHG